MAQENRRWRRQLLVENCKVQRIACLAWNPTTGFSKIKEVITISIMRTQLPSLNYFRHSTAGDPLKQMQGDKEAPVQSIVSCLLIPFCGWAQHAIESFEDYQGKRRCAVFLWELLILRRQSKYVHENTSEVYKQLHNNYTLQAPDGGKWEGSKLRAETGMRQEGFHGEVR